MTIAECRFLIVEVCSSRRAGGEGPGGLTAPGAGFGGEFGGLDVGIGDGKHGGAGAGHEGGTHFAVLKEPVFQSRQQEVLLKDGAFEVIDHGSPFAELRGVKHAGDLLGIGPFLVGPRGGDGEGGLDEDDWQSMGEGGGLDDLAPAGAIGGGAVEQEAGHVRADLGGDFEELRQAERAAGEVVRGAEEGGGIAAAST